MPKGKVARHRRSKVILVFSESANDSAAIIELSRAIRPELPSLKAVRRPIVLRRDISIETKRKFVTSLADAVRAANVPRKVISVFAHRDCDEIEPAHERDSSELIRDMKKVSIPQPVAVTPAYEIEAWWYLWPTALRAVRPCWTVINKRNQNVGMILNAKEQLTSDLRGLSKTNRCPDYSESDSIAISRKVKELGVIQAMSAISNSFNDFRLRVDALDLS